MDAPNKKRKATYLVRKEEQQALEKQVHALQQQLQALQDGGEQQRRELLQSLGLNAALRDAVDEQHSDVAEAQSLLSEWLQRSRPATTRIHLGTDWRGRRETLLSMKDERLARGVRYVSARCRHLKPLRPQLSEERFEDDNGDFCCVRNEVIPLPGVQSLRKAFDAVRFTVDTMEISITEQLGQMTLRDDYDTVDEGAFITNYRLATTMESGMTSEANVVLFAQIVEGEEPYGIVAIDTVDQDDLHPYNLDECTQKEVHASVLLLPVKKTQSNQPGSDEDETVIVVMRSYSVKACRPRFSISERAMQELRDSVSRWGDVVLEALRRAVYT